MKQLAVYSILVLVGCGEVVTPAADVDIDPSPDPGLPPGVDDDPTDPKPPPPVACGWARGFGDELAQDATALAVNSAGDIFIGGVFSGGLDFDGTVLTSDAPSSLVMDGPLFVAKLDASGQAAWARDFGPTSREVTHLGVTTDGAVVLSGGFEGTLDVDGTILDAGVVRHGFVSRLGPDGHADWTQDLDPAGASSTEWSVLGLAVDPEDNAVVWGIVVDVERRLFVRKIGPSGELVYAREFVSPAGWLATGVEQNVAVDAEGRVAFAGTFFDGGELTIDGQTLTAESNAPRVFVVALDAAGELDFMRWLEVTSQSQNLSTPSVAFAGDGSLWVTADFGDTVDLGGGALSAGTGFGFYVVQLDVDGGHLMSRAFPSDGTAFAGGLAVDASGDVVLAGAFDGHVTLDETELYSGPQRDAFVATLDPTGAVASVQAFGEGNVTAAALALAPDGTRVFAGQLEGDLEVCADELTANGERDFFVASWPAQNGPRP